LIALLRQFSSLHSDRKQVSVGFVGYPNVGKSSIINTLRKKAVAKVAPIAGETKVWQYVTLMKRIYLIDCPGIVPPSRNDRDVDLVMRGVVRIENVDNPAQYMEEILQRVQPRHLQRTYDIKGYENATEFLEMLARKSGRLLKGGEPDLDGVAIMVINAYLRGKIPWFISPPKLEGEEEGIAGREGRLGEMGRKRKRDELSGDDTVEDAGNTEANLSGAPSDDDFEGFDDEETQGSSDAEDDAEESFTNATNETNELAESDSEMDDISSDSESGD
jgi:nuclear GTP-binding protein